MQDESPKPQVKIKMSCTDALGSMITKSSVTF